MKNISAELAEDKIRPKIYGSGYIGDDKAGEEPKVFQKDTHYNLGVNPFNYSYDKLPFEVVNGE